jgi:hypothetical protein
MNQIDVPSLLFPLLILSPLRKGPRVLGLLLAFAAVRSVLWALGSQQTRFLLPVFPALAVVTAHLVCSLVRRRPSRMPWHVFLPSLAVALSGLTLFYQVVVMVEYAPHLPAGGWESSRQFLRRVVRDYPAIDFLNRSLPPSARALQIGDGQAFYCQEKCVADPDHFHWAAQINRFSTAADFAGWMNDQDLTHLFLSWEDLDFLLQHDPTSTMLEAVRRLREWMPTECFRVVFSNEWTTLAEVACQ